MNGQAAYDGYNNGSANSNNDNNNNNNSNYGYSQEYLPSSYDGGPFANSAQRDPFSDAAYYSKSGNHAPRSNSLAGSGFHMQNPLKTKKNKNADFGYAEDGDGDDKDVAMPTNTAAKHMNFNDITHIRDRGRYGGFDAMDTAPIIPTLESPLENFGKKSANNIQYRKAMSSQKKQMAANIAKMNNSYQHNHNLLNPIGADPNPYNDPNGNYGHTDSLSSGSAMNGGPFPQAGGGPRSMSLATGSAQRFPPNRQMPFRSRNNNFPPPVGGNQLPGPRSMSFTNAPSNLNPMRQQGPPGSKPPMGAQQQQRPILNNDPRAMSLQSGRLPPFAPKPIGPMSPMGAVNPVGGSALPPNQGLAPGSRNGSLPNMQNPMGGSGNFGPGSRNDSFTNMQNPVNDSPRNGSFTNLQNPMGMPRNQSFNNMQNPMSGPPSHNPQFGPGSRNGSLTNMHTNGPVLRMGSMPNQPNPMNNSNALNPRLNSLPNGPNPRMTNGFSPDQAPRMNSLNSQPNPMYQNPSYSQSNGSHNNVSSSSSNSAFNNTTSGPNSAGDTPPPPPVKTAFDRAKTPSPKKKPAELYDSDQYNTNVKTSSPLRNNGSLVGYSNNSANNSPKRSPFKTIDEPDNDDEGESINAAENKSSFENRRNSINYNSGRIQSPKGKSYQRSSLSHELFKGGEHSSDTGIFGDSKKTERPSLNYNGNEKYLQTKLAGDDFHPYTQNDQKNVVSNPSFDMEDNYVDNDNDDDLNFSAYDQVTERRNREHKTSLQSVDKLNNSDDRLNSSTSNNSSSLTSKSRKPLRKKPPTDTPKASFGIDSPYKSQSENVDNNRSPVRNNRNSYYSNVFSSGILDGTQNNGVANNDKTNGSPSKIEDKKNTFMAKLEASIDNSMGTLDVESSNLRPIDERYSFLGNRISRSDYKTLSPDLNDASNNGFSNTDFNGNPYNNNNGGFNNTIGNAVNNSSLGNASSSFRIPSVSQSTENRNTPIEKQSSASLMSSDVSSNSTSNKNNSSSNNRNSNSGSSGIAGGFLKKLGLKKKGSISDKDSSKKKSSRNSKRESKTGGASFAIMKPADKNNRTSYPGNQGTNTTSSSFSNYNNNTNGDTSFSSTKDQSEAGGNSFSQKTTRNSILDEPRHSRSSNSAYTGYNHGIYDLEEEKAVLFSKPQPKIREAKQSGQTSNDFNSNPNTNYEQGQQKQPVSANNNSLSFDNNNTNFDDKPFGESLSGAFDVIGTKLDKEFYANNPEIAAAHGKRTKDQELAAEAQVKNEYMKMTNKGLTSKLNKEESTGMKNIDDGERIDLGSDGTYGDGNDVSKMEKAYEKGKLDGKANNKSVPIETRLNFTVEQLGILEANQSLINELQLMTKELTDSIQREVKLENDLRNYKMNHKTPPSSNFDDQVNDNGIERETLQSELREKSLTIAKLMTDLNEERRQRKIAEEHVLLWEKNSGNNADSLPSALELNYEKSQLESQLIDKQELINQQQQLIYQFDAEKLKIQGNYNKVEAENMDYKKRTIPDLTNEIELLRNHELKSSKKLEEKLKSLTLENEQLKLDIKDYKSNNLMESQRDALRDALKSLKEQKDKEMRLATDKISYLDQKVQKLSDLNERLQNKLLSS